MSPYAAKVHCFLHFKGIPFEIYYLNPLRVEQELPVGRQIPVLTIDGVSKADSTPIGLWLDERFPGTPRLLPEHGPERERLLALDAWVSERLIPGSFRSYPGDGIDAVLNAWKLSTVMTKTARGGIPFVLRASWPLVVRRVPFAKRLREQADDGLPVRESKLRLHADFLARLGAGPFLGGRDAPSLPDLAAYPQFALFYCVGFRGADDVLAEPKLMEWLRRMTPYVEGDPPLLPSRVTRRALP
jgi:glutathione S-transferase